MNSKRFNFKDIKSMLSREEMKQIKGGSGEAGKVCQKVCTESGGFNYATLTTTKCAEVSDCGTASFTCDTGFSPSYQCV